MDAEILKQGGDSIIPEIAKCIGVEAQGLRLISASENFVYEYGFNIIIRVCPASHSGLPAVQAITVSDVQYVKQFYSAGITYYAVLFNRAKGNCAIDKNNNWIINDRTSLCTIWGRTLGKMHRLASSYIPVSCDRRKQWDEVMPRFKRQEDCEIYSEVLAVQAKLKRLLGSFPKDNGVYGIIHSDLTPHNFFVEGQSIHPFDFDHCKYHWYIYDIAIILHEWNYLFRETKEKETCLDYFLTGYKHEYHHDEEWFDRLPLFIKLWKIDCFIPLINHVDMKQLEPWQERLLRKLKRQITKEDIGRWE